MNLTARFARPARRGFSLIELLVVIAIIAILAGLLFPVFSSIRENGRQAQCMTQMREIIQAMKMYHDDFGRYPDGLLGVAYAPGGPLEPRLQVQGGVKSYVKDSNYFTCPNAPAQYRSSLNLVQPINPMTGSPAVDRYNRPLFFAQRDSYSMQYFNTSGQGQPELHYSLRWQGTGAAADDPRQLANRTPAPNTVVTWCTYHAERGATGVPKNGTKAIVGFLDGKVVKLPSDKLTGWPGADGRYPWQVTP